MKIILILLSLVYMIKLLSASKSLTTDINSIIVLTSLKRFKENSRFGCLCGKCNPTRKEYSDQQLDKMRKDFLKETYYKFGFFLALTIELFCLLTILSVVIFHT